MGTPDADVLLHGSIRTGALGASAAEAIRRMAAVPGLSALELNYPQHLVELGEAISTLS